MSDTDLSKRSMLANSFLLGGTALGAASISNLALAATTLNVVDTFAQLAFTPANTGDLVEIKGHTISSYGGGIFVALSGSVQGDGGTRINATGGAFYWQRLNCAELTVEMFGAVGNGIIADDQPAIQAAIIAAEASPYGFLRLANSNYTIKSPLIITKPITIVGGWQDGKAFPGGVTPVSGSTLTWDGGTGPNNWNTMVFAGNVNAGLRIERITFDGVSRAAYCLHLDSTVGSNISDCWFKNAGIYSFLMDSRTGTCSWNTISRCRFSAGYGGEASAALCLIGYEGGYNPCHNTIINVNVEHARGAHGILLGFCDNCTFIDIYINRGFDSGIVPTGIGVTYSPSGNSWAYANTFIHMQSGNGGYVEPPMPYSPYATAQIFGYALDNAEPPPVLNGNTGTCIISNGNEMFGFRKLGVGTSSVPNVPAEFYAGARGTHTKFGNNGYIGSYDDQNFYLSNMAINGAGTFIAKANSVAGIGFNGSKVTIFGQNNVITGTPINGGGPPNVLLTLDTNLLGFYGASGIPKPKGFGTPTGGSRVSNFNAQTATLAETKAVLADLLTILKSRGDIGS
jgi:hypothetical protein